MNNGYIKLTEALKLFNLRDANGMFVPFDIEYRTFNSQTKQGGKLKAYQGVKYLPSAKKVEESSTDLSIKNPNHYENRTRNIELPNGEIKKLRIDFIVSINNTKVIY
ncbi:MAG: hypothetical protein RJA53_1951 [Bacteroidota bacterium]